MFEVSVLELKDHKDSMMDAMKEDEFQMAK